MGGRGREGGSSVDDALSVDSAVAEVWVAMKCRR